MVPMTVAEFVADYEAEVKEKGMRIFHACGKALISGILPKLRAVLDATLDATMGGVQGLSMRDYLLAKAFATHLKHLRKAAGLTQAELAIRAGMRHREAITQLEKGRHVPSLAMLLTLARALGQPLLTLVPPAYRDVPAAAQRPRHLHRIPFVVYEQPESSSLACCEDTADDPAHVSLSDAGCHMYGEATA
jgi:transcriptional regulator with XRE-family HTH domain